MRSWLSRGPAASEGVEIWGVEEESEESWRILQSGGVEVEVVAVLEILVLVVVEEEEEDSEAEGMLGKEEAGPT